MSAEKNYGMTAQEAMASLNGFDEEAIERAFGKELDDLSGRDTVRAIIFVLERRAGVNDRDAKKYAKEVRMGDLDGHFEATADEVDDEDPETEQGKELSAVG